MKPTALMISILSIICAPFVSAIPGGTYVLTGNEKSIQEIISADMEQYPDLYKGESLSAYVDTFKRVNNIGQKKLTLGDNLVFPETAASRGLKEAKAAEEAAIKEHKLRARNEGVYQYQQELLPSWILRAGERAFSRFESGIPQELIRGATELVDANFAESMQLKSYPAKKLYIIVFETPARSSQCYLSAFKAEDSGFNYFTLEKGLSVFGVGDESVLWVMGSDGERVKLGARSYTDVAGFVSELEQ
jgi:hypothetical protein